MLCAHFACEIHIFNVIICAYNSYGQVGRYWEYSQREKGRPYAVHLKTGLRIGRGALPNAVLRKTRSFSGQTETTCGSNLPVLETNSNTSISMLEFGYMATGTTENENCIREFMPRSSRRGDSIWNGA